MRQGLTAGLNCQISWIARSAELVVEAEPNHAGLEFDGVVGWDATSIHAAIAAIRAAAVLQLHVEIFVPGRNIVGECGLNSRTRRPAGLLVERWKLPLIPDETLPNAPPSVP